MECKEAHARNCLAQASDIQDKNSDIKKRYAANEQNASGGIVVTASNNGSCGQCLCRRTFRHH